MKWNFLVVALSSVLCACQPHDEVENLTVQKAKEDDKSALVPKEADLQMCLNHSQLIDTIYGSELSIDFTNKKELIQYFDLNLTQLIMNEKKCRRTSDVCKVNFDILSNSQDPQYEYYEFSATKDPLKYMMVLNNSGHMNKLYYTFNESKCPRITNIIYNNGTDLVSILK